MQSIQDLKNKVTRFVKIHPKSGKPTDSGWSTNIGQGRATTLDRDFYDSCYRSREESHAAALKYVDVTCFWLGLSQEQKTSLRRKFVGNAFNQYDDVAEFAYMNQHLIK